MCIMEYCFSCNYVLKYVNLTGDIFTGWYNAEVNEFLRVMLYVFLVVPET